MSLKTLLLRKLPQDVAGVNGFPTIYAIGTATGYKPQAVSAWFTKDRISIEAVERLMQIPGHTLTLEDFAPHCPELKIVLDLKAAQEAESNDEY